MRQREPVSPRVAPNTWMAIASGNTRATAAVKVGAEFSEENMQNFVLASAICMHEKDSIQSTAKLCDSTHVALAEVRKEASVHERPERVKTIEVVTLNQVEYLFNHSLCLECSCSIHLAVRPNRAKTVNETTVQKVLQDPLVHIARARTLLLVRCRARVPEIDSLGLFFTSGSSWKSQKKTRVLG